MKLLGLHHVTAMTSNAKQNLQFYTEILGLRLVKKTVNFDDPTAYHLYFGDAVGSPGSILTFFPWATLNRGRPGRGQVNAIAFAVPPGSLSFWSDRLATKKIAARPLPSRFGESVLQFTDSDGLPLELIETNAPDGEPAVHPNIPAEYAIRRFHSITIPVADAAATQRTLVDAMGYQLLAADGSRLRFTTANGGASTWVDLFVDPQSPRGSSGAGTVHHVAFRVTDDAAQLAARTELSRAGYGVSPVMDRNYFHSIYYREPDGVLFEIATDPPGFAIDEPVASLGHALKLPEHYELHRAEITAALPPLTD